MAPQVVAALDFTDPLKLAEIGIEFFAVGHRAKIENAAAYSPWPLVPFRTGAKRVAPGIGGIIERAGIDQRPVHEILARVLRIFVLIEYVGHRVFAQRDDK